MEIGMNTTAATTAAQAAIGSGTQAIENSLDKDAFLRLLVTQLKYQDPMSPMDNKESIAQLAQFSALEQMQNLNKKFDSFFSGNDKSQALNVLGLKVAGTELETGTLITGTVKRVAFDGGKATLTLDSGKQLELGALVSAEVAVNG